MRTFGLLIFIAYNTGDSIIFAKVKKISKPPIPICRKQFGSSTIWLPELDKSDGTVQQRYVIFGGVGEDYLSNSDKKETEYLNDLWALQITDGGYLWTELDSGSKFAPDPRWKFSLNDYGESKAILLFGGENSDSAENMGDIWSNEPEVLNGKIEAKWNVLRKQESMSETGPGGRLVAGSAVTSSNTLFVTNGKVFDQILESYETCDSRTFSIDLNNASYNPWIEKEALPGLCRWGLSLTRVLTFSNTSSALDAGSTNVNNMNTNIIDSTPTVLGNGMESLVLFGGRRLETNDLYTYFNELWLYNLELDSWSPIKPVANEDDTKANSKAAEKFAQIPMPRDHHGAVYVEELDSLFIHGGRWIDDKVPALDDLWSFNFKTNQWKLHNQPLETRPCPRFGHGFSVWQDESSDDGLPSLIVFGGEVIYSSGQHELLNDLWLYSISNETWKKISPTSMDIDDKSRSELSLSNISLEQTANANVGCSDCSPATAKIITYPIISAKSLFSIVIFVIVLGSYLAKYCFAIKNRKHPYVPIMSLP